jgi:dipeptidase E
MNYLLTSAGITNPTIQATLVELLGKPIAESSALVIPTASYGMRGNGPSSAWKFISGREPDTPMVELGWRSVGVLELTALPSIEESYWLPTLREADVLLVGGGDPLYLAYWMRGSGVAALLPSLTDTLYVGLSAGSMIMAPRIGEEFVGWRPPVGGDETLGVVDFAIFPHLDHPDLPDNALPYAEQWAAKMPIPTYAIDDQTAITVVDGAVAVVTEGHWRAFP